MSPDVDDRDYEDQTQPWAPAYPVENSVPGVDKDRRENSKSQDPGKKVVGHFAAFFFPAFFFTPAHRLTAAFFAAADRSSGVIFAYRFATISEPIDLFSAMAEL